MERKPTVQSHCGVCNEQDGIIDVYKGHSSVHHLVLESFSKAPLKKQGYLHNLSKSKMKLDNTVLLLPNIFPYIFIILNLPERGCLLILSVGFNVYQKMQSTPIVYSITALISVTSSCSLSHIFRHFTWKFAFQPKYTYKLTVIS